ncbi:hybrid sensor histidine kinase/response regulator, partial [bacterium]|nr:hybrid sensor histidine kinase/response regulator [bacterium]
LEEALDAAGHASELTRQLLAYAGKGQRRRTRFSLAKHIDDMRKLLLASVGKVAKLTIEHGEPCEIECDGNQLQQIILNLIINATEAVGAAGEGHGRIVLRTDVLPLDEAQAAAILLPGPLRPGRYAMLEIVDDGIGMDDATRSRIFDPFFTTKSRGHGLGTASVLG